MKVYTKKGDKGSTQLIGGTRLPKHHPRIEAYGTVDELNSHVGLLRDVSPLEESKKELLEIQDRLFTLGCALASDPKKSKMTLPGFSEADVLFLENAIDQMDQGLPVLKSFILAGGHVAISQGHIARCVCRRAERASTLLSEAEEVDSLLLTYLNRLSDYLFVLCRKWSMELDAEEKPWQPRI